MHKSLSCKYLFAAALLVVPCAFAAAEIMIIHLNTGGIVRGKLLEQDLSRVVVLTPCGTVVVAADEIDHIERGESIQEIYRERLDQLADSDIEGHFNLGVWLRNMGMADEAKAEFEKVIKLDPDHQSARCELGYMHRAGRWMTEEEARAADGYVKYRDRWVLKEEAEKLEAGYIKYQGEWVKKEELEMVKKGFRRLEGTWVSQEEYYRAKGMVKHGVRWVAPEEAERLKKLDAEREAKKKALDMKKRQQEGKVLCWDAQISAAFDADEEWIAQFQERVRRTSETLWELTQGQAYIATAVITDKDEQGNWVVQNPDQNRVDKPGGQRVFAYCDFRKIVTGGLVDRYTACHELGHLLLRLHDEYSKKGQCIMAGAGGAFKFCPECISKIKTMFPNFKFPNETHDEKPPETVFKINNR